MKCYKDEKMDFKKLINSHEYDFLREDPHLRNRIILLGVSGSYGYGTNREGSDVDLRGIALNRPSDILGLTEFEQFEDRLTDTVVFSFNKMVGLLLNCNPNTMEILGLDEDQYLICTDLGRKLLENRHFAAIQELLKRKKVTEEKDLNPQMPEIIGFIKAECSRQKMLSEQCQDDHKHDFEALNQVFREIFCCF